MNKYEILITKHETSPDWMWNVGYAMWEKIPDFKRSHIPDLISQIACRLQPPSYSGRLVNIRELIEAGTSLVRFYWSSLDWGSESRRLASGRDLICLRWQVVGTISEIVHQFQQKRCNIYFIILIFLEDMFHDHYSKQWALSSKRWAVGEKGLGIGHGAILDFELRNANCGFKSKELEVRIQNSGEKQWG